MVGHELWSCYMRSRFTQLAMNVQVGLKTEISVEIKSAARLFRDFFFFYHRFMQCRFRDADSDCFMREDLSASVFH